MAELNPHRIVLILPCCIGDVIMATATLRALRRAWPQAHITWAVGTWSRPAIENHADLNALLDTGSAALPVKTWGGFWAFVHQLRAGQFDLAVSLVRSPLMSLAVWLSGIPQRAGLDSGGRGWGYNIRATITPADARPEGDIYLDVARALGLETSGCYANLTVEDALWPTVAAQLAALDVDASRYFVVNPAGGRNPGMTLDSKRWPPAHFAQLISQLGAQYGTGVLVAGPDDSAIVQAVQQHLPQPVPTLVGVLSFPEIALLARRAQVYIGNDTGLTHLAAAAGAKTVMILGPSDPRRYAPFVPDTLTLWRPAPVHAVGVSAGAPKDWDWRRDGITVDDALQQIQAFMGR